VNPAESIRPPASTTATELAPARRATRLIFLLAGISLATWAPMVPFAKAHLQLNDAQLGLVLLGLGFGAMAVMPLAGFMTHRFGNRNVIGVSALLVCVALPLLTIAPTMGMLMAALLFFGAVHGVVDVAMNAHAVEVERRDVRPLMSGFHGLFSVGGLIGAAAMSGLLELGAPLLGCAIAVSVLLAIVVLTQWGSLLGGAVGAPDKADTAAKKHSIFVMPSGIVFLLGFLCFISFMAEGSMLDWSAVFLRFSRGFDASGAGIGYAVFSVAMATGRLFGDRVTTRLGPTTIVRLGALLAAAGFVLATTLPWGWAALAGFVLVGLGSSNIVPVLFSAAGRVPGTSPGITIAAVTTLGYAGMLAAPAAIGYIAHATSLPLALSVIAVLLVVVAACAGIARR
jgi:predicted MFS family arabinose efflux permease